MYGVSASCSLSSSPMEEFHIQVRRMRCCCDAPTSNISLTKWQMQIQIQMRRDDKCRSSSPSGAWLQDGKPPKLSSGLVRHHARMLAQGIKEPTSTVIILPIFENFDCLLHSKTTIWYSLYQDAMKRPTFETLQWKLEDFFTMSDSEYKDASAYWTAPGQDQGSGSRIRIQDQDQGSGSEYKDALAYWTAAAVAQAITLYHF